MGRKQQQKNYIHYLLKFFNNQTANERTSIVSDCSIRPSFYYNKRKTIGKVEEKKQELFLGCKFSQKFQKKKQFPAKQNTRIV